MVEVRVRIQIERLQEGVFLATSNELPGMVVQAGTLAEIMEIAQDVAQALVDSYVEHGDELPPALRRQVDAI